MFFFFDAAKNLNIPRVEVNEQIFRWEMNEDQMANDKLSEGIRKFAADAVKLENIIRARLQWTRHELRTKTHNRNTAHRIVVALCSKYPSARPGILNTDMLVSLVGHC